MRHLEESESGQEESESGQEESESGDITGDVTGSGIIEESPFYPPSPPPDVPPSPTLPPPTKLASPDLPPPSLPTSIPERFFFELEIILLFDSRFSFFDKDAFRQAIAEELDLSEDRVRIIVEDRRRKLQEEMTLRVLILAPSREEAVNLLTNVRSLEPFSSSFLYTWGVQDYVFPTVASITSTFCESGLVSSPCLPPPSPPLTLSQSGSTIVAFASTLSVLFVFIFGIWCILRVRRGMRPSSRRRPTTTTLRMPQRATSLLEDDDPEFLNLEMVPTGPRYAPNIGVSYHRQ